MSVTDFRSYASAEVELEPGVSTFVGPNGYGKTNLVEALGYVATLGSHRVSTEQPLVRSGSQRAVIRVQAHKDDRAALVEVEISPGGRNRAQVNRSPRARMSDIVGLVRTVLFAPEDLALVKADPQQRRRFIDDVVVARAPRMAGVRADYERVLRQRNALLKSAGASRKSGRVGQHDTTTLDVWDAQLASVGAQLLDQRLRLVREMQPLVEQGYSQVAGDRGSPGLQYLSHVPELATTDDTEVPALPQLEAALLAHMHQLRETELQRGVSLTGPHRDDLLLTLDDRPAKGYASHGESWSLALALRLAHFEVLRVDYGDDPILVLDDVFAELDSHRRQRLAELASVATQVLVTAAVPDDVPKQLQGSRFAVTPGQVSRVET